MVDSVILARAATPWDGLAGTREGADPGARRAVGAGERQLRVAMHPLRGNAPDGLPEIFLRAPRATAEACRRAGIRVEAYHDTAVSDGHQAIHVHWPALLEDLDSPHAAERALHSLAVLAAARRRGARVVWSADPSRDGLGATPPGAPAGEPGRGTRALFERGFLRLVSDVVVPTADAAGLMRDRLPLLAGAAWHVLPPVIDRGLYPSAPTATEARAALGLDLERPTVLRRGRLAQGGAVENFLRAAGPLVGAGVAVILAGEVEPAAYRAQLLRDVGAMPGALLVQGTMPVDEVPTFLAAADVVDAVTRAADSVPARSGSSQGGDAQEGGAPGEGAQSGPDAGQVTGDAEALAEGVLALGFGRPVVLTDTPDTRLLAQRVGRGWVHLVGTDALNHTDAVWAALEAAGRLADEAPDLSAYTPEAVGAALVRIYTAGDDVTR